MLCMCRGILFHSRDGLWSSTGSCGDTDHCYTCSSGNSVLLLCTQTSLS